MEEEEEEEEVEEEDEEHAAAMALYHKQMAEYEVAKRSHEEQHSAHTRAQAQHAANPLSQFKFKNKVHRQSVADYHINQKR